jgi:hypothetical protein
MVVERNIAGDDRVVVYGVVLGRDSSPEDDGVRVGVPRRNPVCEVEIRRLEAFLGRVPPVDLVQSDSKAWVVLRWRAVVDVLGVVRLCCIHVYVVMLSDVHLSNSPPRESRRRATREGKLSSQACRDVVIAKKAMLLYRSTVCQMQKTRRKTRYMYSASHVC